MTIGGFLSSRRQELGLTLEEVGAFVGVSKATVSRWESGDIHKMKRDKIDALSDVLHFDPVILLSEPELLIGEERSLLFAYRNADEGTKASVLKLLDIPYPKKESDARQSAI